LELEKETTLPQKIESILLDNLEAIKTYDANKDGVIDETELQNASKVAQYWTNLSLYAEENWLYFGSGKPIGSMSWEKIEIVRQKYPEMFVSFEENGNSKNIKFWLPIRIMDEIKELDA
jgi:Ca2+-binding EF-hand superfamily protein